MTADTRERLRALLAARPNICEELNLADIGKQLGVSRERVRQLMPEYVKNAREHRIALLARYVDEHPEALLPRDMGGMVQREIAAATGLSLFSLRTYWLILGLPPRSLLTKSAAYGVKSGTSEYDRRWMHEVIGTRVCVVCGKSFPWTLEKQSNWKAGRWSGETCGVRCGKARAKALR